MKSSVVKIELVSEIGTFKFEEHFNSTANPYQALCMFESCNWEMLGETHYIVYNKFDDGKIHPTKISGMNASADLYGFVNDEEPEYFNCD